MKKKILILIGTLAILGTTVYCGTSYYKYEQSKIKEQAVNDIENGNYQDAVDTLSKKSMNADHEKLLELASTCKEMEEAYNNKDYKKVEKLAEEIKTKKYLNLLTNELDEANAKMDEKIKVINSMPELENKINDLINNNSFDEAERLLNEYMNKGIDENKIDKINSTLIKVKDDNEKLKIALEENKETIDKLKALKEKIDSTRQKVEEEKEKLKGTLEDAKETIDKLKDLKGKISDKV